MRTCAAEPVVEAGAYVACGAASYIRCPVARIALAARRDAARVSASCMRWPAAQVVPCAACHAMPCHAMPCNAQHATPRAEHVPCVCRTTCHVSNTTRAPVAPPRVAGDGRKQQPPRAIIGRPILDTLCDELGTYRPFGSGHAGTATGRAGKIRTIVAIPGQLPAPLRAAGVGWIDSMEVRSGAHRLMRPRSRSACLRPSPPGGARHRECRNNRESR